MSIAKVREDKPVKLDVSSAIVHTGGVPINANDGVDRTVKNDEAALLKEHQEFVKNRKQAYEDDKKLVEDQKKAGEAARKTATEKKAAPATHVGLVDGRIVSDASFAGDLNRAIQTTPRDDVVKPAEAAVKPAEVAKPVEPVKPVEVKK